MKKKKDHLLFLLCHVSNERDSLMLHEEQMVDKLEYMKPKDELLSLALSKPGP